MKFIIKIFFTWLAIIIACYLLPGVSVNNYFTALIVAAVWALLDRIIKPLLIILTLPITVLTFGIFLIFINAIIVQIDAHFVHGFIVKNIWWALIFSFIVSVIVPLFEKLDKKVSHGESHRNK